MSRTISHVIACDGHMCQTPMLAPTSEEALVIAAKHLLAKVPPTNITVADFASEVFAAFAKSIGWVATGSWPKLDRSGEKWLCPRCAAAGGCDGQVAG